MKVCPHTGKACPRPRTGYPSSLTIETSGCDGIYMKMPLPFFPPPLPSKRQDAVPLFPPPRRGREGWGLFSCFVVPHSGMRVSRFPGLSYSRGSILTGTAVFFLKVSLSSSVPIPLPTCMGMASLGRILSAAAAASSAVIT